MTACVCPEPWVVPGSKSESRIRLFGFPYAGSSAQIFRDWHDELPEDIELSPVHLPGRGRRVREDSFTDLFALAEVLAPALSSYFDKPYALFGHSIGAVIAFEVARVLRREGMPLPCHLFVSGCRAPQFNHSRPYTYDLPEDDLIRSLRNLNGTPSQILESPIMMEFFLPIIRADLQMIQTYQYSDDAPFDFPITAFGGLQDREETQEMISAWREQTTSSFQLQMVAGDHFFLHTAYRYLLQTISQQLTSARDATWK